MGVQLDRFSIALLILRPDAPVLDDEAAARLQNEHMAHLAELHEAGHLLAAGPLLDENFRGLSIVTVEPDQTEELKEADPAVRAARFSVKVIQCIVQRGAVSYSPPRFPRSMR